MNHPTAETQLVQDEHEGHTAFELRCARAEIERLRDTLTNLKARLIEVNTPGEMGGIDCELVATIDVALGLPSTR